MTDTADLNQMPDKHASNTSGFLGLIQGIKQRILEHFRLPELLLKGSEQQTNSSWGTSSISAAVVLQEMKQIAQKFNEQITEAFIPKMVVIVEVKLPEKKKLDYLQAEARRRGWVSPRLRKRLVAAKSNLVQAEARQKDLEKRIDLQLAEIRKGFRRPIILIQSKDRHLDHQLDVKIMKMPTLTFKPIAGGILNCPIS